MDCVTLLSWIPVETKLSDIRPLLIAIDAMIIQKDRANKIRIAVAQNLSIQTEYDLMKVRRGAAEVQYKTLCQTCLRPVGQGWLAICPRMGISLPDDYQPDVYHLQCRPQLKGPPKK